MQARIIITAALATLALAVPTAQARMEDSNGGGSEPTTAYATPAFVVALAARNQAEAAFYATVDGTSRPDDRSGIRGVGTGTSTGGASRPDDRSGVRGVGADPALSGIDLREIAFSGGAVLALIALFVTRMRSRQNDVTRPAPLSH